MKPAKIELKSISEKIDPFAIKNFIISDNAVSVPKISSEYPFILDGVAFVICERGTGRVKVNFREYSIEKNTVLTILPHYVIEAVHMSDDMAFEFLVFSPDFVSEMPVSSHMDIARNVLRSPVLKVTDQEIETLLKFHSFIVRQYKRLEHPFRKEMARTLLYALLIEIAGIYSRLSEQMPDPLIASTSHQEELLERFFKLLITHHREERGLQFYADKMCITPKYLSTVVKENTGRTAFTWISEAMIASAKYMLKASDKTVVQISDELNFPNPSFFGRFFKKHAGTTPMRYREG